jgi:hypothetical protein
MHGSRRWIGLGLFAWVVACSSGSHSRLDGSPTSGAGGAVIARDAGTGGGGTGGRGTPEQQDAALGGAPGVGGTVTSGGGTASSAGAGGLVGAGGRTGGALGSGGQTGSPLGHGGGSTVVDAALGGTGGGQSGGTGGGGGTGPDGGMALDAGHGDPPYPTCGNPKGTLGGSATQESAMQRYAVIGVDCRKYVVQNNNFGNPTGSVQTLSYAGASFQVVSSTASSASGTGLPASFPSLYIGANGPIAGGAYATWSDSNLPIPINALTRALTTFDWSGGAADGDFAASYDIWFAKSKPVAGSYDDAISGSLMIWLNKPSQRHPVGQSIRQATVGGRAWDVWVGPHGDTALGTDDPARPVVSYVTQDGPLSGLGLDLANFIADAVANGSADMAAAHTSQALWSAWYLTDVLAGFQIWTGSDAAGLTCASFTCQVK